MKSFVLHRFFLQLDRHSRKGLVLSQLAILFLRTDCFHMSFEEDVYCRLDSLLLNPSFAACHSLMPFPTAET